MWQRIRQRVGQRRKDLYGLRRAQGAAGSQVCIAIEKASGITALTVADLDYDTGVLNLCKANTEPGYEESSNGSRYEVSDWTKGGYQRKIRVDRSTVDLVHQYVLTHGLDLDDLLFRSGY